MTLDRPSLSALFRRLLGDLEYMEEVRDRYEISYDEPPRKTPGTLPDLTNSYRRTQETETMNTREIAELVDEIGSLSWDYEAAHSKEDQLYERFVLHVRTFGPPELAEMAAECLKTKLIKFPRHCA